MTTSSKTILQTLALPGGKIIQLLEPDQSTVKRKARNIIALDQAGKELWTIQEDLGADYAYSESVWVSIALNEAGELWAQNFRGFEAQISIQDGQILQKKLYR